MNILKPLIIAAALCFSTQAFSLTINGCDLKPSTSCPNVDLSRAGAGLRNLDLRNSNFSGAKFCDGTGNDISIRCADLSGTNLSGANLSGAILGMGVGTFRRSVTSNSGTDLTNADLSNASARNFLYHTNPQSQSHRLHAGDSYGNATGAQIRGAKLNNAVVTLQYNSYVTCNANATAPNCH